MYACVRVIAEFQFTPLREGRLSCNAVDNCRCVFQFTPLREGRHGVQVRAMRHEDISIHAPPRGATNVRLPRFSGDFISIHAPPRGATRADVITASAGRFQFTPLREGRRRNAQFPNSQFWKISIHAPPRGATDDCIRCKVDVLYFNSRPSARGDLSGALFFVPPSYFNSRPSARGDITSQGAYPSVSNFNSRPSARGDKSSYLELGIHQISIHAPPRGATLRKSQCERFQPISIHAPPRGATPPTAEILSRTSISIHAPPRGATAKDMQFLQIFCSTLTNQHGLTIVPRNLSRLFW